jgi:hypothetical protein
MSHHKRDKKNREFFFGIWSADPKVEDQGRIQQLGNEIAMLLTIKNVKIPLNKYILVLLLHGTSVTATHDAESAVHNGLVITG